MKLIVGLGNPGAKYQNTRHNAGYIFSDAFALLHGSNFKFSSKFKAAIAQFEINNEKILLTKPETYMNLSGYSVKTIMDFYKVSPEDILIVYDDISLDLGKIRFRPKGSDGGHNGIKSIITSVGTDKFDRLKIGIGPQPTFMASEAYVLQNFSKDENNILADTIKNSIEAVEYYLKNNITTTQNKYN